MKSFTRSILALSFVALFVLTLIHAIHPSTMSLAALSTHPLTTTSSAAFIGGGILGQIGCGLACGAGIVGIAGGALSGVGLPAAIMGVSAVAGACIGAFDA